jgi:hypothetical protein
MERLLVPALSVLFVAAGALAIRATRPADVVVGADGVTLRRALRKPRFIHFQDIAGVSTPSPMALRIELTNGRTELIGSDALAPENLAALALRLREALASRAKGAMAAPKLELLARGGRDVARWIRDLKRASTTTDYRSVPLSSDDLAHVLESPDAEPEQRIGAAVALRVADGDSAPQRIRVAAELCANDEVRGALEALAEGEAEDAAVERALRDARVVR